jgi:hypothetical protein
VKYQALTLKTPGIARNIAVPVVASQSKTLCQKYGLEKAADAQAGILFPVPAFSAEIPSAPVIACARAIVNPVAAFK